MKKSVIDPMIFWPTLLVIVGVTIPAIINPEAAGLFLDNLLLFITGKFGWLYLVFGLGSVVFLVWLALGKYGKVVLGDQKEKPEYSQFSWIAMLFCAGMGSSLIYWAVIEPIYYITGPPFGLEPGSQTAFEWAAAYGPFHWGITPWAIYALSAVPIAYSIYIRKQHTLRFSTASIGAIGEKNAKGLLGKVIDVFCMFGLIGGLGTTMGLGTPMVSALIATVFNVPESMTLNIIIVLIWTALFTFSVYRGLAKGIKILSDVNVYLALFLAAFVLIVGPTAFIFNNFTNALMLTFQNFIKMSLWTDPIGNGGFPQAWTIFYWAWWLAIAPMMGLFVARISKGRTIREVIFGEILWGTLGSWLYFAVFGGHSLHLELTGGHMTELMAEVGAPMAIATILNSLPLSQIIMPLFIILQFIFLATTLDSSAYILASMSTRDITGDEEPARWNRLVWSLVLSGTAVTLMIIGGLEALKTSSIIVSLPVLFIFIVLVVGFMKHIREDYEAAFTPTGYEPVCYDRGVRISKEQHDKEIG